MGCPSALQPGKSSRNNERNRTQELTSLKGAFFRNRYITLADTTAPTNARATITGLNSHQLDNEQTIILTPNDQPTIMGAQSFMQAFYPPYTLANGTALALDPTSVLSDNTYIDNPMNGYQYPQIQTFGIYDPNLIYVSGESGCDEYTVAQSNYYNSASFVTFNASTASFYKQVGSALLTDVLRKDQMSFVNAYAIYDYLSYMNHHNSSFNTILSSSEYQGVMDKAYYYASLKAWNLHANLNVSGLHANDGILTIAGQTLAARVLSSLMFNYLTNGTINKFNLVVGDYPSMMGLLSLMGADNSNPYLAALPSYASALVFELYSWENGTGAAAASEGFNYPSSNGLYVRFLFRNTTGDGSTSAGDIQSYPLFGRDPSASDMPWKEFQVMMNAISTTNVADWCQTCASSSLFCPGFTGASNTPSTSTTPQNKNSVTPQVAGVIGAGVTIGVLALLLGLVMALGGIRFHQNNKSPLGGVLAKFHRRSSSTGSAGGYKGSAKLASDTDLHIPKNAAPIGIAVTGLGTTDETNEPGYKKGHERVGSWELQNSPPGSPFAEKQMDEGRFSSLTGSTATRDSVTRSFEGDDERDEAEIDRIASVKPVKADERV